jgi:hypothetical protein
MFKEIFQNESALGGYGYRVTADDKCVHVQRRWRGGVWKTVKRTSLSDFEAWAESVNLYNPYDQNPAKLSRFAEVS